ncbi:hypothetical protein [Streptomyces sp. URMC 123]|uniref:hypothetical protein n=1 Tax=Streptomyces sp. URMC 123 TaxID=3423403 RepID=UPI003F19BA26
MTAPVSVRGGAGAAGAAPAARAGGRSVLLAAAGLHMVTQSALAPFYPALFRAAYGVRELAATGLFLVLCQVAAVVALPLWGRASARFPLARLLTVGQSAAVLLAASLAFAPSYAVFTALSLALIAAKAVVLLAYPGLARSHPGGLLPGVVQYVAVLHAASVAATLLGAVVVSVPDPRAALPLLAVLEAGLLLACVTVLGRGARAGRSERAARGAASAAAGAPEARDAGPGRAPLLRMAGYVLVTAVAVYAVRPYFTEYAAGGGAGTRLAALLFVLPHLAVLATLPAVGALHRRLGARLLPAALLVGAAGLLVQTATAEPLPLAAGRLLFGVGLGLSQVALDERVLAGTGTGPAYSVIAAAQTGGLLLAPLVATAAATWALWAPLPAGAALLTALALFASRSVPAPAPTPAPAGATPAVPAPAPVPEPPPAAAPATASPAPAADH